MKKILALQMAVFCLFSMTKGAAFLHNDYSYLQDITFELYTDDVPVYKVPEQIKSIEESLMFEVLHATWKDKHWVAYTLNKNLLGTFKVGQPALMDDGDHKKMYFVASFPGSVGGLDLYVSEYSNNAWSKPKNLGKNINTKNNESNPGLLNDHTLTYSSGGIIKKLDLNTLKVVDLEETAMDKKTDDRSSNTSPVRSKDEDRSGEVTTAIGDNSTATPTGTPPPKTDDYGAIGDNSTAMPTNSNSGKGTIQNQTRTGNDQVIVQEKQKTESSRAPTSTQQSPGYANVPSRNEEVKENVNAPVEFLGTKTREEMLAKYKTAIQLGAFSTPKWELFSQLSKYGKLVSFKNDKNMNVVWITGFANHAAAEAVLPQVKSVPGFENSYITGK